MIRDPPCFASMKLQHNSWLTAAPLFRSRRDTPPGTITSTVGVEPEPISSLWSRVPEGVLRPCAGRRTRKDFAQVVQTLLGKAPYRRARRIRIVLDNLNTQGARSFFQVFPRETAKRILRKLEFHYTPKHASWPNMAEIEMSILQRQCLGRRIPTEKALKRALGAWQAYRIDRRQW